MGNEEAKELVCTIHGHEQSVGNAGGRVGRGWRVIKGRTVIAELLKYIWKLKIFEFLVKKRNIQKIPVEYYAIINFYVYKQILAYKQMLIL